jgi:predicted metal-dependent hydrolase
MPAAYASPTVDIEYTIRRSDRARRVRVTVDVHQGVEVVLPRRAREREAAAAVAQLRPWIERRLAESAALRARIAARGATVPYLGRALALRVQPGRTRVHRAGDALLVPDGDARAALERWYRRAARDEVGPRVASGAAVLGVEPGAISIRGQRTRWGSCSSSGALSFNWRLLLAPEEVLDYVVWHELCHLRVMNHSPRFWKLVEQGVPGYRGPRRWLADNGATLVL